MTLYDQLRRKIPLADQLRSKATYRQQLNAAVRGLWLGPPKGTNAAQFEDAMQSAIDRGFRDAWKQGMEAVGLTFPDDMTAAEQAALFEAQAAEYGYIGGLAGAVMAGSKENGGKLGAFKVRIDLWVKRYLNIVNQAKLSVAADPVLVWNIRAEESCISCLKLAGQRRRASVWKEKLKVWPQHPDLECMHSAGGPDVCQCTLDNTDRPPTRGRLPKWRVKHLAGSQFDHDQQTHGSGGGGGWRYNSNTSAKERERMGKEWLDTLRGAQGEVLRIWFLSGSRIRQYQNESLPGNIDREDWRTLVETWEAMLDSGIIHDGPLYRGLDGVPQEVIDGWIENGGLELANDQSATYDPEVAGSFFDYYQETQNPDVLFEIDGEGVDISPYTDDVFSLSEKEVIIRAGTTYRIISWELVDGVYRFKLRQVSP